MNKTFIEMVDEAYDLLNNNNNDSNNNILLPKLDIDITITKLYWKNIMDYINIINRNPEHIIIFLKNELSNNEINWYSENKNDGIIIHGKGLKKLNLSELIRKYINNYVICSSCKKKNTELNKLSLKKYEFKCLMCYMTRIIIL
jgi:translation initiation factor 2 subunit 2